MITQDMLFKGSNYVDEILRKLRRVEGGGGNNAIRCRILRA